MNNTKQNNSLNNAINHYPSNRFYPWLIIALCALFLIYKYVLQVYPSIMTDELMAKFNVQGVGLGNLAATFFYSYLVMQLFAGVLLDKYSPRFITTIAIFICALGAVLFASTSKLLVAELARALMGLGAAFATANYMKMAANWFKPEHFAFVGGLLATVAMAGAVFGEAPLAFVVDRAGWQYSIYLCALFGGITTILYFFIVRDKPKQFNYFLPDKNKISWRQIIAVVKNKQNWLLLLYNGLIFSPITVFGGLWGNAFLREVYHLNINQTASLVSLIFIGLAFGGPILGLLSDLVNNRRLVMLINTGIALVALLIVIYSGIKLWLLGVVLFVFGFTSGALMLEFAIARQINNLALAGTVVSFINTGDPIFGSFSDPLVGKLLDLGWDGRISHGVHVFSVHNFHLAFIPLLLYLLAALLILFFINEQKSVETG